MTRQELIVWNAALEKAAKKVDNFPGKFHDLDCTLIGVVSNYSCSCGGVRKIAGMIRKVKIERR
ncbi:hypothetical protein LCGC14_2364280 [marine sediment metagenome]|uniref:Uncharacterized protein n=1 Tax=marine sediment metagenome TaxID=412755 RepID=A0A0F9F0F5_9ZZZZ